MPGAAGDRTRLLNTCGTSEVVAGTRIEPHLRASLAGNDAKAVVFNLMQPRAAGRQRCGFGREAGRDEAGGKRTRTGK